MTTEIMCQEHTIKVAELIRRCNEHETRYNVLAVEQARLETRIEELEVQQDYYASKVHSLQAWKNKALGYLGMLGILTMYIIESFRDHFWGR